MRAAVLGEACNICDKGNWLLSIAVQEWINGMMMAGLMRFIVLCEPQVSRHV